MDIPANKFVQFDQYCTTCKYCELPESEDPCNECLTEPVNLYSHKPVYWKEGNRKEQDNGYRENDTSR